MDDKTLKDNIATDSFHKGLDTNGEFPGFGETERRFVQAPMTDDEIKASRSKLARLIHNPQVLLVLTYIGLICLMGKAYA